MASRDKIEKLRRLAQSGNRHEAARAREAVARLSEGQPDPVAQRTTRDPAYPDQLPAAIRIPTPLGRGS